MIVDEAADRLRQLLSDAGFDSDHPCPAEAWAAFKRFVAEPAAVPTTELWFEAADGEPDTDSPAYFDFVRLFTHYPDDGAEHSEQVTAHFTAQSSVRLGLGESSIQATDVEHPASWFAAVEASPSFRIGVRFTGWSFEVRVDGC